MKWLRQESVCENCNFGSKCHNIIYRVCSANDKSLLLLLPLLSSPQLTLMVAIRVESASSHSRAREEKKKM
jgi:hypothetical protein